MSTQKKYMGSSHFKNTAIAIAVASSFAMAQAWAADTAVGSGNGVAYGTGSQAAEANNVAIGNHATISYSNGATRPATGDIAVGHNARTNNYVNQGGGIAIGENAFSENMAGTQEESFNFGQTTFTGSGFLGLQSPFIPADPTKVTTGIAIGQNAYARSGGTMIGTHNYKGVIGDTSVDTSSEASMRAHEVSVYATTVGANSFNNSAFGVVNGAFSAITGAYDGGSFRSNASQNFGATITGSLNTIESKTASSNYSGVGNTITGVANRTFNSNGSIILGAGNEITNSVKTVSAPTSGGNTPNALATTIRDVIKNSDGGGATLAIGGANKADYTLRSQMIGVNNSITGTAGNVSTNNMVNGYANEAENVKNVSVIGSKNKIENTNTAIVLGDKRTLNSADNSVILGSSAGGTTTNVKKAVAIGAESNVTVEGGVALGADSIASTAAGIAGYDLSTGTASTDTSATWKATAAAVSVGNAANNVTRQITGVAAGAADTDAVNVAQLKKATAAATTTVATTDSNLTVAETPSGSHNYQVGLNKNLTGMQSAEFTNATGTEQTRISQAGVVITKDSTTVSLKATGLDNGGQTITNVYAGSNDTDAVNVRQLKDSRSKVETAQPTYVQIQTSRENPTTNSGATIYSVGLSPYAQSGIDYSNTYLGPDGIDANGKKITNVAPGSVSAGSTDAVNGGQLYQTNQAVQQNSDDISKLYNRSAELNRKIHRAGAHAAALAALHPLDFDENHRVSASLGLGQYHSSGAAALGIFVRPTENFMVSLGGSIASGSDVMGNLGVHYRFGGDSVRVNKTELTQQVSTLTAENRDLSAKLASSNSKLEAATSKIDSLMERIHAIEAKLNMK
mgnify:FL=1